jgi:aldose 1-epimerase
LKHRSEPFGRTPEGEYIALFHLDNGAGLRAAITSYGGRVTWLEVPDRKRRRANVVLGFDDLEEYLKNGRYLGAIIGRFAGRISDARFSLDGRTYRLHANDGRNHLHGGLSGFDKRAWSAESFGEPEAVGVRLRYESPDGEEGYPGTVRCRVEYRLTDKNELRIDYEAVTDRSTPLCLTHHGYFNLLGRGDVLGHELTLDAARFAPIDPERIPTGELAPVERTPFDFRSGKRIGRDLARVDPQLVRARQGYDHAFALARGRAPDVCAARLVEPESGRMMEVFTTEPVLHLYTGNNLRGPAGGQLRSSFGRYGGLCLEAQRFPDAPNQPAFPSAILHPGETYRQRTTYRFSTL